MSSFNEFVNRELPRRSAFLTVAITGFDGDPNSGGAPSILQSAPVGTWYLRETPLLTYRKLTAGATGWVESAGGAAVGTLEDISIPVDYNDGTAVDPPTDAAWTTQAEFDNFLIANSATAYKHIALAYHALSPLILHQITMNCAAGVHRPDPTNLKFDLIGKVFLGAGAFKVVCPLPSSHTQIVAPQTITSHQQESNDPSITVGGTPFAGLDLRGKFAVLSTGQTVQINSNTNDTLFVCDALYPDPTDSSDTVFVSRPATIFRNSLDDISPADSFQAFNFSGNLNGDKTSGATEFSDFQIDAFGATFAFNLSDSQGTFTRVIVDHEYQRTNFSITPNGRDWQFQDHGNWTLATCSGYADPSQMGSRDEPISSAQRIISNAAFVNIEGCYFGNSPKSVSVFFDGALAIRNSVFDNISPGSLPAIWVNDSTIIFNDFGATGASSGCQNRIINKTGAGAGLLMEVRAKTGRDFFQGLVFGNIAGPCVQVGNEVSLDIAASTIGLQDLSANSNVGIDIIGIASIISLDAGTNVSGSVGEIRFLGTLLTHAEVSASPDPFEQNGNLLIKA